MYFTAPVYVQRQYTANAELYKIHAVTKTNKIRQGNSRPLYEMLVECLPAPAAKRPQDAGRKPPAVQEQAESLTRDKLLAGDPNAGRNPDRKPVPSPLDRAARSRPYDPFGRFREPGFDADFMPPKPLGRDQQQPWQRRRADMARAYDYQLLA